MAAAEEERGSPPFISDVLRAWLRTVCQNLIQPHGLVLLACADLYLNDEVLADWSLTRFSLLKENQRTEDHQTDFELYSDRVRRAFPLYTVDEGLRFVPKEGTPTINWTQFRALMVSKDLSRLDELKWIDEQGPGQG